MFEVLTHDILPVFAMLALGFALGWTKRFDRVEAAAFNRVAFLCLQPALILPLIAGLEWDNFEFATLAGYVVCQIVVFSITYWVALRVFGREPLESWLLAMATIFVNTLLYIWPISILIYGEAGAAPVTAIVAWDAAISFAFFIITTDIKANPGVGPGPALRRLAGNPVLIAIALGIVLNLAGVPLPEPLLTAFDFAGAGAAPLTLFALGVILSGQSLALSGVVVAVCVIKLVLFPLMVWGGVQVTQGPEAWQAQFILASAGPSGAMAFSLALLYGVRTDSIAPVIIWTSLLTLISLAVLA